MKNPQFSSRPFDLPNNDTATVYKLPDWVKCYKCGKPPEGFNWLQPVDQVEGRKLIHLNCIEQSLTRQFEHQR